MTQHESQDRGPSPASAFEPAHVVEDWLERAALVLSRCDDEVPGECFPLACRIEDDPELAYDLLGVWEGLGRLAPGPGLQAERNALLERVGSLVATHSDALACKALEFPDPEAWLQAAQEFLAGAAPGAAPEADREARARRARELFVELDEAELVLAAVTRLWPERSVELDEAMDPCRVLLAEHGPAFASAAGYLTAFLGAMGDSDDPRLRLWLEGVRDLVGRAPALSQEAAGRILEASTQLGAPTTWAALVAEARSVGARALPPLPQPVLAAAAPRLAAGGRRIEWSPQREGPGWRVWARLPREGAEPRDASPVSFWVCDAPWATHLLLDRRELPIEGEPDARCATLPYGELHSAWGPELLLALASPDEPRLEPGTPSFPDD